MRMTYLMHINKNRIRQNEATEEHVANKRKVKVLEAQSCLTVCDPWAVAHQAPLAVGFSRQKYWSGLPFPGTR